MDNESESSPEPIRVLVWSINYAPEATGIAPCNVALCEYLLSRGHEVEMVTTFPYYPMWQKLPTDRGQLYRRDEVNGVPVHRCWHYVPRKVKSWKRIVHEATFVATSFLKVLLRPRADVMVVVSPPLLLGAAAWIAGMLKRSPFVFHVQDLQPDAAVALGMLRSGLILRALYALEGLAYRSAARVSGITRSMLDAFTSKGVPLEKQSYLPNGAALPEVGGLPPRGRFRDRLNLAPEDLLAVYSGNLGVKQGLPILIDAAAKCGDARIQVVICGDGAEREALAARAAEVNLHNVRLLPLQDRLGYEEMLVDADICLITQQAGTGRFFFPSKLLTTLAFGKAVLVVADHDSELSVAVKEGEFGFCVPTGYALGVAQALDEAAARRAELPEMGQRGREYVAQFASEVVLEKFERVLLEVAEGKFKPQRRRDAEGIQEDWEGNVATGTPSSISSSSSVSPRVSDEL